MTLDGAIVVAFLLCLVRTSAWIMTAPFMAGKSFPALAKLAVAISISLFSAPLVEAENVPTDILPFAGIALGQVLVGLALGWVSGLFLHAFEIAGTMIDTSSGFSIATMFDPVSGTQTSIYARFYNMLFLVLLFVTNAHLTLIGGFVRSFGAIPADEFPVLALSGPAAIGAAVSQLMVAALMIGAPVLGALFLTEVALALAARFAPQANIFVVGLPLKVMISILAVGTALILLPQHLPRLVEMGMYLAEDLFA
ncbi:MAG: flagellar biosynthetic protein FliR [Acidimicrobiales bacterium]|nr:flagellar biosynthetic protein FliR [Acidimicrobiales bacterium]